MKHLLLKIMLAAASALALEAQSLEAELQRAAQREMVSGDRKAAIQEYQRIAARAASANKKVAALALMRMAESHARLGDAEARRIYERVVREFGDQAEVAATARARLAALTGGAPGGSEPRFRLLWNDAANLWGISADGRWVAYPGEYKTRMGGVSIRDLFTGEVRTVTERKYGGSQKGWTEEALISPDGLRVAFLWGESDQRHKKDRYQVRLVDVDGRNERVLLDAGWTDSITEWVFYEVAAWSPDGKGLVVMEFRGRRPNRLLLVSPDATQSRVLFTFPDQHRRFSRMMFSPDGKWLAFDTAAASAADAGVHTLAVDHPGAGLNSISQNTRMAGWTPRGDGLLITKPRDTRRELFVQPVSEGRASGEARKIHAVSDYASWTIGVTRSGALIYEDMQRTAEAQILELAPAPALAGNTVLKQALGGWDSSQTRYSPDGQRVLFSLAHNRILLRDLSTGAETTVTPQLAAFSRVEWAADGRSLFLMGRGRDGVLGLYRMDLASGAVSALLRRSVGVFTPSRDGRTLVCHDADGFQSLDLNSLVLTPLPWAKPIQAVTGLRFSHDGKRLAVFGEGKVAVIDTGSGSEKTLISSPWSHSAGDWSPDDRYLYWTWGTGVRDSQFIRMPAEGGDPLRVDLKGNYVGVELSPDGQRVLMVRRSENPQVWALENFLPAK